MGDKYIILLEQKMQRLINELNGISKKAKKSETHGEYKYLIDSYIWKSRILKRTEERLKELFINENK